MLYNWSNKDILNDIKELEKKLESEKNIEKKAYYVKVIDCMNSLLMDDELSKLNIKTLKSNILYDIADAQKCKDRYYKLCEIFHILCYPYVDRRNSLYEEALEFIPNTDTIPDEEIMTLIHDSYYNVDDELYKYFMELYKNRHTSIRFQDEIESLDAHEIDGSCIYVDIIRKNYIQVYDENGVYKLINTAHEVGHAVANLYNSKAVYNRLDDFLAEVPSLFFELVISHDVARNINPFETAYKNLETFSEYYNYASLLSLHNYLVDSWFNNNNKANKEYYRELKSIYKLTRSKVDEALNTSLEIDGPYVIGYMIALELFNIYKQDKKSAIRLLKEMLKDYSNDSYCVIQKLFPYLSNFNKEVEIIENDLQSEVKKMYIK